MSILQWGFLAIAIGTAIAELHFGTVYLAGVSLAALVTVGVGFLMGSDPEVLVFIAACAGVIVAVPVLKRRFPGRRNEDLDVGQTVVFVKAGRCAGEAVVNYRGALWEADVDPSAPVAPGTAGRISARLGNRLTVVWPPASPPSQEP